MIGETIRTILAKALGNEPGEVTVPEGDPAVFGHFSTTSALRRAKAEGKRPMELAGELAETIAAAAPEGFFEKVEAAAPGFVNMWVSADAWRKELAGIVAAPGGNATEGPMAGKTVMVEYTDPNPFKLFHIGHFMSNAIGESFARLYEMQGAKVVRANYQGDVGLHVAKAIWGMERVKEDAPKGNDPIARKMAFLGEAYARGAQAYENEKEPAARGEIEAVNEAIYAKRNDEVNEWYAAGRAWSLEYFEAIYARLGTKFDRYYFESEMVAPGVEVVEEGLARGIFKKSDGATVFPGEEYGLHTRVFINSRGLPTYEAKELGLNRKKFEEYPLDLSVIVTGSEVNDYFRVLLKAMELMLPDGVAVRTRHVGHGMLRLPTGKMSSRTGDVITADALLAQVKERLGEKVSERSTLSDDEREAVTEAIAVGAVKYSILKQNPGADIVFDFEKSLSFEGDAGPYLQYAHARLRSVLRKAAEEGIASVSASASDFHDIGTDEELALVRKLAEFPAVAAHAAERLAPSAVAAYCYKLAVAANKFYETTPILKDDAVPRRAARLALAAAAADVLRAALATLGIAAPERI
jgi:arginyl-tRNA synthetase